jgi:hypothetical protein
MLQIQTHYAGTLVDFHRAADTEPLLRDAIADQSRATDS